MLEDYFIICTTLQKFYSVLFFFGTMFCHLRLYFLISFGDSICVNPLLCCWNPGYSDWPSSYQPVHVSLQVNQFLVANRGKCVSTDACLKMFSFGQNTVISTSGKNSKSLLPFCALPLICITPKENGTVLTFQACKLRYWSCNWLFPNRRMFQPNAMACFSSLSEIWNWSPHKILSWFKRLNGLVQFTEIG